MANTLSQVQSVLVDISGTLQVGGELTLKANIALNQSVMSVVTRSCLSGLRDYIV